MVQDMMGVEYDSLPSPQWERFQEMYHWIKYANGINGNPLFDQSVYMGNVEEDMELLDLNGNEYEGPRCDAGCWIFFKTGNTHSGNDNSYESCYICEECSNEQDTDYSCGDDECRGWEHSLHGDAETYYVDNYVLWREADGSSRSFMFSVDGNYGSQRHQAGALMLGITETEWSNLTRVSTGRELRQWIENLVENRGADFQLAA